MDLVGKTRNKIVVHVTFMVFMLLHQNIKKNMEHARLGCGDPKRVVSYSLFVLVTYLWTVLFVVFVINRKVNDKGFDLRFNLVIIQYVISLEIFSPVRKASIGLFE